MDQTLSSGLADTLGPYLPRPKEDGGVFVTLTYAQSLDSRISLGAGIQTAISHTETKQMTQYLRYHHDGILIGTGTVLADDPGLNCKVGGLQHSPVPIVIDLDMKWKYVGSKMQRLYNNGEGHAPVVIVRELPAVCEPDVRYLAVGQELHWDLLFIELQHQYGIQSVMVEGGAQVIQQLLQQQQQHLVDSLVVTVAPVYLGQQGVSVSPPTAVTTLGRVSWWTGTTDAVLCAKPPEKQ